MKRSLSASTSSRNIVRARARVAVVELNAAARIAIERRRHDRKDRRDAASRGERGKGARARSRSSSAWKLPFGVSTSMRLADRGRAREVLRHAPVLLHADADRQPVRAFGVDDGIGPPFLLPVDAQAERDMLAGTETEFVAKRRGYREAERDRIVGDRRSACDRERMELQHGGAQMHLK